MSINAATSPSVSNSSSVSGANSNTEVSKKSSSESSFKDEMNKVSSSENKKDEKNVEKTTETKKTETSGNDAANKTQIEDQAQNNTSQNSLNAELEASRFAPMSMINVNSMLSNDIEQMVNNTNNSIVQTNQIEAIEKSAGLSANSGLFTLDFTDNLSVSQSDAEFFVNLTQKNDVSVQNITTQAQTMLNQGADVKEVQQNVRISETLLNAINNARETNQPLRIDFDQNVSVILRIGKDGAIAANFIPGDKAVEQYLKNNIESLKNTFNENDLPYSDLSYSNRGSKQQKERRNNQK